MKAVISLEQIFCEYKKYEEIASLIEDLLTNVKNKLKILKENVSLVYQLENIDKKSSTNMHPYAALGINYLKGITEKKIRTY